MEKTATNNKRIIRGKNLMGKGKHIVKVADKWHITSVGRLKDKSTKIIYIHQECIKATQCKKCKI